MNVNVGCASEQRLIGRGAPGRQLVGRLKFVCRLRIELGEPYSDLDLIGWYDMKAFFKSLAILMLCPIAAQAEAIQVNAGRGDVIVHLPDSHGAGTALPLVILLHGLGADGDRQENGGTLDLLDMIAHGMTFGPDVEAMQFMLALPSGRKQGLFLRHLHWNATDACCSFTAAKEDDGAYIVSLIDVIAKHKAVSAQPSAVYLVGHSNGGFLAHQIACRFSEKITGIVTLAGMTFLDADACASGAINEPLHVLHIHGDADVKGGAKLCQ